MQIIFEDSDILVLNKPAGQLVHADFKNTDSKTVVDEILEYYPDIKEAVLEPGNPISEVRPGIVHRLDKDTSGLLVVAKNCNTLLKMQNLFREHKVHKYYTALLFGNLPNRTEVDTYLSYSSKNKRTIQINHGQKGWQAISIFSPTNHLQFQKQDLTLCQVEIKTGRTHQIRIQAASIQHPVIGDEMYGSKPSKRLSQTLQINRQFLHASKLSFPHPQTQKLITFETQIPEDLEVIKHQLSKSFDF
ncbi:MAG: hypothetical protein ACD_83C00246G0001 [uncultured bacterium]|uniref:Pseudouridine synthase n=1 Tax=Berkelbacteria bacterium GW2011_GWA2_38_9 TaxID=1618334 RepID=A0A0G0NWR4_9BACT|nr:MAG: hypothetical protein ACD_83C00246G0001 [uncultured bacterium]KKQ90299.1 MAG: Pseudouridine synthase [Berkelbacteria bacterium GW2011_GWA2_38_9]